MRNTVIQLLTQAVGELQKQRILDQSAAQLISVERVKDAARGDFASNLAMKLARLVKSNPA